MTFIYYKVIYFCSLNIHLNGHKVKMISGRMLLLCTCKVTVLLLWSLFFTSRAASLFLIHCTNCWKKKYSILFYSTEFGDCIMAFYSI